MCEVNEKGDKLLWFSVSKTSKAIKPVITSLPKNTWNYVLLKGRRQQNSQKNTKVIKERYLQGELPKGQAHKCNCIRQGMKRKGLGGIADIVTKDGNGKWLGLKYCHWPIPSWT